MQLSRLNQVIDEKIRAKNQEIDPQPNPVEPNPKPEGASQTQPYWFRPSSAAALVIEDDFLLPFGEGTSQPEADSARPLTLLPALGPDEEAFVPGVNDDGDDNAGRGNETEVFIGSQTPREVRILLLHPTNHQQTGLGRAFDTFDRVILGFCCRSLVVECSLRPDRWK